MNFISATIHNASILNNAEDAINNFVEHPDFRIWIEDEEGNQFVPKGKIKVNYIQGFQKEER